MCPIALSRPAMRQRLTPVTDARPSSVHVRGGSHAPRGASPPSGPRMDEESHSPDADRREAPYGIVVIRPRWWALPVLACGCLLFVAGGVVIVLSAGGDSGNQRTRSPRNPARLRTSRPIQTASLDGALSSTSMVDVCKPDRGRTLSATGVRRWSTGRREIAVCAGRRRPRQMAIPEWRRNPRRPWESIWLWG